MGWGVGLRPVLMKDHIAHPGEAIRDVPASALESEQVCDVRRLGTMEVKAQWVSAATLPAFRMVQRRSLV